jgi:hypothetical protein
LTSRWREVARVEKRSDDLRVQSAGARLTEHFVSRQVQFQSWPVRAALGHRLEGLGAGQNPRRDVNVPAPTATVIARAVNPLVMHSGDARHRLQC